IERGDDLWRSGLNTLAREPQAHTVQAVRVDERRVVGGKSWPGIPGQRCPVTNRIARLPPERDADGRRIARIRGPAGDRVQRGHRVAYRPSMGPDRVLGVRNGNHAGAAHDADRLLES